MSKIIDVKTSNALNDLANFVAESATPRKSHGKFWQAYRSVSATEVKRSQPARVGDLLGKVMAISARTRRIVSPKMAIELDVFTPGGRRAVQLTMGHYN